MQTSIPSNEEGAPSKITLSRRTIAKLRSKLDALKFDFGEEELDIRRKLCILDLYTLRVKIDNPDAESEVEEQSEEEEKADEDMNSEDLFGVSEDKKRFSMKFEDLKTFNKEMINLKVK